MASAPYIDAFKSSCLRADEYPLNLSVKATRLYPSALEALKHRLGDAESHLLLPNEEKVDFSLRDLSADGEVSQKRNIHDRKTLREMIGLDFSNQAGTSSQSLEINKQDPKCRFLYIYGATSRSPLKITRGLLSLVLTFHQVMPTYLDFIFVFGQQEEADDIGFAAFREQVSLSPLQHSQELPELGRSGQGYQICYNLKGISRLNDGGWSSIRQAAIHHQYDAMNGNVLWIVTKGHVDIQQRYKELTGKGGRAEDKSFNTPLESFRSSLSTHLMLCFWAVENWRWYIKHLEKMFRSETNMAVYGRREPGVTYQWFMPSNIQDLQWFQDSTNEVIMVLESNIEIFSALINFYKGLVDNPHFPLSAMRAQAQTSCAEDVASFCSQVEDMASDLRLQIGRSRTLLKISSDRKELVIQHLQSQTTERTERLNENMEKEAIMVRIITIVTLIYLPATFVSTFFSTDIIKYQDTNNTGKFSDLAMKRWLEVAVPLTFLTLFFSWYGRKWAEQRRGFRPTRKWRWFRLLGRISEPKLLLPLSEKTK